ncbi:MAG: type II toxin-antitoxin system VapC family toxin [Planctomycetes bacterium]|nr:type II toxin-antitoxin system VapC family toxin [Planctomycetota bacterium]
MRILLDTNVLARLAQPTHRQHAIAARAVEGVRLRGNELCIVPQVLYELWVVCTRPAASNGLAMGVAEARAEISGVKQFSTFYRDERAIFGEWERLVAEHDVKGKNAHDARLVAAMLRHGLTHILTFNAEDFQRFDEITVLTPEVIAGSVGGG